VALGKVWTEAIVGQTGLGKNKRNGYASLNGVKAESETDAVLQGKLEG
jgi:hypothetical protein